MKSNTIKNGEEVKVAGKWRNQSQEFKAVRNTCRNNSDAPEQVKKAEFPDFVVEMTKCEYCGSKIALDKYKKHLFTCDKKDRIKNKNINLKNLLY